MKGLFSVVFLFAFFSVYSQGVIRFETQMHDFGTIQEVNGVVKYNFEFTNQGSAPVLIKNVESSCGCTSPEWTKQPILPGKKGIVTAIFSPKDRPGYFDKTITVYSNAKPAVTELKIKGIVQGKTRTLLDDYPYELPSGLRLPLEELSLMKVRKGETKSMNIGVYNNAGKPLAVSFSGVPAHIQVAIDPQQVNDKSKAAIKVAWNTAQKGEYGLNREKIFMTANGKKYEIPVSVFVEEDFSKVADATAPQAEVNKKYYSFGQIPAAQSASFECEVKNVGKTPLKIHRIYTNDERVTATVAKNELQPGETAAVVIKTISGAAPGKVASVVSIVSNSPLAPELKVRFQGEIK